jgi:hypothetical protein
MKGWKFIVADIAYTLKTQRFMPIGALGFSLGLFILSMFMWLREMPPEAAQTILQAVLPIFMSFIGIFLAFKLSFIS